MTFMGRVGLRLAMIVALPLLMAVEGTTEADAAKPLHGEAMATCRAKYGMGVTSVTITKNGLVVCREGPGTNATRQEVYDHCRKRSGATVARIRKLSGGKWECLHNGSF